MSGSSALCGKTTSGENFFLKVVFILFSLVAMKSCARVEFITSHIPYGQILSTLREHNVGVKVQFL